MSRKLAAILCLSIAFLPIIGHADNASNAIPLDLKSAQETGVPLKSKPNAKLSMKNGQFYLARERGALCYNGPCGFYGDSLQERQICFFNEQGCKDCYLSTIGCPRGPKEPPREPKSKP